MDEFKSEREKPTKRVRVTRTPEFKRELVRLASEPNASLSGVAVANGVNPNLLRRWVRQAEEKTKSGSFVPVVLGEQCSQTVHSDIRRSRDIEVVLEKAGFSLRLTAQPVNCLELGQVLREILR